MSIWPQLINFRLAAGDWIELVQGRVGKRHDTVGPPAWSRRGVDYGLRMSWIASG